MTWLELVYVLARTTQQEREALADAYAVREPLDETWQNDGRERERAPTH